MALDGVVDYVTLDTFTMVGVVIVVSIIIAVAFDWSSMVSPFRDSHCMYGYNDLKNGPVCWRNAFPHAKGEKQSPINIPSSRSVCVPVETLPALKFSPEYHIPPKEMRACNDGHCVTIFARWENDARPAVTGGPYADCYNFYYAKFRWGPNDDEGSEHTIDSKRYAMEVQATHIKAGQNYVDTKAAAEANAVLNISYLYQITPIDNPYLEPFVSVLKFIRYPFDNCSIEPTPLSWIVPPFTSKYFTYHGSLTHPPCTEGVKWMVQTEPLGISSRQLRKFRKLFAVDGPLEMNTRPVQEVRCFKQHRGERQENLSKWWYNLQYSLSIIPDSSKPLVTKDLQNIYQSREGSRDSESSSDEGSVRRLMILPTTGNYL